MEKGIVNIRGNNYVTVARRVKEIHEKNPTAISIVTEIIQHQDPLLLKATVTTKKGTFTGHSAIYSDPKKLIENQSPYEVAETSAIGRALGFAGYGEVDTIATADEMIKAAVDKDTSPSTTNNPEENRSYFCKNHNKQMKLQPNKKMEHRWKDGNKWIHCDGAIETEFE